MPSFLLFLAAWLLPISLLQGQSDRPNVLFILCDDLNDALAGFGGVPEAVTPNVERLREAGVTFLNAACNAPICGPSRASLLTGIHPLTSGYCTPSNPGRCTVMERRG